MTELRRAVIKRAMENAAGGDRQEGVIMEMCALCKNWISKPVPIAKSSVPAMELAATVLGPQAFYLLFHHVALTKRRKRNKAIGHCLSHLRKRELEIPLASMGSEFE